MIRGIAHIGIRVRALEPSLEFYRHLGFELTLGPIGPEPVAILKHPAGIEINFILNADQNGDPDNVLMDVAAKHPGYTHVALEVADVDAARTQLESCGIQLSGGPVTYPHGARGIFIRDPDRNVIELFQPPPTGSKLA